MTDIYKSPSNEIDAVEKNTLPALHLIDVSGYIFRAFFSLPPLNRADGTPVNAVLGYCNMLLKLLETSKADALAAIFDVSRVTFRNEIYPDYKAHRPETPPELVPQFSLIREATHAFGVPAIELDNFEADDLIASYATAVAVSHNVVILSSDKDLMQLVSDRVKLLDPMKNRMIGAAQVFEKFGVPPEQVIDVQALMGDSADNVPGVSGIGPKGAAELIQTFGSLENLLANLGDIKQPKRRATLEAQADMARLSKTLVTLKRDCPLPVPIADLAKRRPDADLLRAFLEEQGFNSLLTRLNLRSQSGGTAASGSSSYSPITNASKTESSDRGNSVGTSSAAGSTTTNSATLHDSHAQPSNSPGEYETVQTIESLDRWIAAAYEAGIVAFDTETTSLTVQEAKLVGICLAIETGKGCYIPLGHIAKGNFAAAYPGVAAPHDEAADSSRAAPGLFDIPSVPNPSTVTNRVASLQSESESRIDSKSNSNSESVSNSESDSESDSNSEPHQSTRTPVDLAAPATVTHLIEGQLPLDIVLARLAPLLTNRAILKIGHNIKYDMNVLANYGLTIEGYDDTMLLSLVLEGGKHSHGMDGLAQLFLGYQTISYDQVTGKGASRINFAEVEIAAATAYAAEDADITLRLWHHLKPRLAREKLVSVYETIERPMAALVGQMERHGIKVDREALVGLSADFKIRLAELEKTIHQLAGREFNVASPAQLGVVLFEEHKLPGGKRSSKTGAWSTDSGILEPLAEAGNQLAKQVIEYREIAKLRSTYSEALVKQINPRSDRVHTNYHLAATTTGRLSSNDPNLQNIPVRTPEGRKIRAAFIAESGSKLLSLDYSQIELRLLAEIADIPTLKQAFVKGIDIHAQTASEVFDIALDKLDKEQRRRAKAINFGIIYGISAFGLANQLTVSQAEARDIIERYFRRYPGIRAYMERTKEAAHRDGFVTTLFGRKCHIQGAGSKGPTRGFAERQAINAPIQGSAADLIKLAMVKVPNALKTAGLDRAKMLLQVHDELLFEVADEQITATAELVTTIMETVVQLSIPLKVEHGTALNWSAAH